jgi:hypothetical protein
MSLSDSVFPPIRAGPFEAEALPVLPSSVSPALSCAVSQIDFSRKKLSLLMSLVYCPSDSCWKFADPCHPERPILFRNAVAHNGELFEVRSVSPRALHCREMSAVGVSRNVATLGKSGLRQCRALQFVAFEFGSHLREIQPSAFSICESLRSIAIPSSVGRLEGDCFALCRSLGSLTFERRSRLATIGESAFESCDSLTRLLIPASVTAIDGSAFGRSGIGSIEIEEGSISFRVVNEFLVDFGVRSLVWVIGSPESIQIPSSIEELRPRCCSSKPALRNVGFESDSNLRSIGRSAFFFCESLESICIPSSVEVLGESCFFSCWRLRTVTIEADSQLRLIEKDAFGGCGSLELVSVPTSVEVIGQQHVTFVSRS